MLECMKTVKMHDEMKFIRNAIDTMSNSVEEVDKTMMVNRLIHYNVSAIHIFISFRFCLIDDLGLLTMLCRSLVLGGYYKPRKSVNVWSVAVC